MLGNMGVVVSELANIGDYDGYVLMMEKSPNFEDEISDALHENFFEMAEALGSDNVLVKFGERQARKQPPENEVIEKLNLSIDNRKMPYLIVLDKHPLNLESGDKCIVFELGKLRSKRAVTEILEVIYTHITDENFIKSLTWEKRKNMFKNLLSPLVNGAGLVISIVGVA